MTLFYVAIILDIEPITTYADTIELFGFILSGILIVIGIKKHSPERRLSWQIFFIATVIFFIGDVLWAYYSNFLNEDPSSPSICDIFYLSNTVVYAIGLLVFLKKHRTISFMSISFDMIVSIFAAAGIMYNFMILPTIENQPADYFQLFTLFFIPIVDFALMAGTLILIFGTDDRSIFSKQVIFLSAAFLIMFVLDELSLLEQLYEFDLFGFTAPLWSLGCFFIGLASLYPSTDKIPASRFFNFASRAEKFLIRARTLIPYFYTFLLLILIGFKYNFFDSTFLWAIILILLISCRQLFVIERNRNLLRTIQRKESKLNLQYLELQRLNQKILHDAEVDFLTQLSNRRYIDKTFERLAPPEGRAESLGILLIDVDFFKRINDTYGHPTGDIVLKKIAEKIKSVIRGGDVAGRFGGDEFIVLLPESDLEIVEQVAEKLTEIVRADEKLSELKVTLSIGGTSQRVDHEHYNIQELLKKTDESLYKAKEGGRNCFVVE